MCEFETGKHKSDEIKIIRAMAWERAKAELKSILKTFYGVSSKYDDYDVALHEFVGKVERQELLE